MFFTWDAERTFWNLQENRTQLNGASRPTGLHQRLLANLEYRVLFGDHVHRHFFNDGPLTPKACDDRWMARAREIEAENVQFRVIEPPQVPVIPSGPPRVLLLSLALAIGLASGIGFAILRTYSRDSIYDLKQLKDAIALPVLGVVSTWQSLRGRYPEATRR